MRSTKWKVLMMAAVLVAGAVVGVAFETAPAEAAFCHDFPGISNGWGEGATCPKARQDCRVQAEVAAQQACEANGPISTYIFESITYGPCVEGNVENKGRDCRVIYTCEFCPAP